jgi:spermidine/putrescine transport system permease protein
MEQNLTESGTFKVINEKKAHSPKARKHYKVKSNNKHFVKSLCIPFALFLVLFVLIPILFIIFYAFTDSNGNFTFNAFTSFFTNTVKLNVLLISILIGVFNTALCLLITFPLSYLLANPKINKNYVLVMLFVMPMWINFVLRTGALRDLLTIILGWFGTTTGEHPLLCTMIGMVTNYIPFTVLPLYSTMLKLDHSQIEAASDLGCNPFHVFTRSIIPQSMPGIVSAGMMVFMPTISSYVISDTLSEGKIMLFGNSIYLSFSYSDWNGGSFMSLIMLIIIFIVMFATRKFERGSEKGAASW